MTLKNLYQSIDNEFTNIDNWSKNWINMTIENIIKFYLAYLSSLDNKAIINKQMLATKNVITSICASYLVKYITSYLSTPSLSGLNE